MTWLPKSPKARRRLWLTLAIAPVVILAAALSLWAMSSRVTYCYTPSEITPEAVPAGQVIRLGGLVQTGSAAHDAEGAVRFVATDGEGRATVTYHGALPDLFREGQGVIAQGAFDDDRAFRAREVLAKHDETYMPREVADKLKARGEWRAEGA